jgi:hypothetical protein
MLEKRAMVFRTTKRSGFPDWAISSGPLSSLLYHWGCRSSFAAAVLLFDRHCGDIANKIISEVVGCDIGIALDRSQLRGLNFVRTEFFKVGLREGMNLVPLRIESVLYLGNPTRITLISISITHEFAEDDSRLRY